MIISDIRRLSAQIKSLERRIEGLRTAAEKCTGVMNDMPRSTQQTDKTCNAVTELVELQYKYAMKRLELERIRDVMMDRLTPTEAEIVELRDIEQLNWIQISYKVNMNERWCRRLYKKALEKMKRSPF